jgi:hypothetical protein
MAYNLTRTDGTVLINLGDGYIDSSTGVNLIGRNTPSYGDAQNQNFVRLLENFADTLPPSQTVAALNTQKGTVWYDTANQVLRVYDGANWNYSTGRIVASSAPLATGNITLHAGDQWYDNVNNQLNTWDGTQWQLIGPQASSTYGKSGSFVETILDPAGIYHVVVNAYSSGNLISVTNYDSTFTPLTPIAGFTTINPGINLNTNNNSLYNGTATNSTLLANITPAQFARRDQYNAFASDINVAGNITFGYANIRFTSNNNIAVHNNAYQGNVNFYVNSGLGNINTLHIDGVTGLATVYGDPVTSKGIATKNYVDSIQSGINANVTTLTGQVNNTLSDFSTSIGAELQVIIAQATANLTTAQALINSNVSTLSSSTDSRFNFANIEFGIVQTEINSIDNYLPYLATTDSPAFTGIPTAPNVQTMNNYISSLQGSEYVITLESPSGVFNQGDYLTQILVAQTWQPNTNYSLNSLIENTATGNSYIVYGNVYANSFSYINPDNIQYLYTGRTHTTANFAVRDAVNGATQVNVSVVSGSLNVAQPSIMAVNGINLNNAITGIQLYSTGLQYPGLGDNSANIATTAYVDATANLVYGDYVNRVTTLTNYLNTQIAQLNALKANIDSPTLTGNAAAPTLSSLTWQSNVGTPLSGDSTTRIATTAYVAQSIQGQKFNYTVSSQPPSGGNDGDFWFQVS